MAKRELVIDVKDFDTFRLVGTGLWADFGDAWLCAHDIFHHDPLEPNKVVDEVKSFGTQLWLEYPSQGLEYVTPDALAGALLEGLKSKIAFDRLLLPQGPDGVLPSAHRAQCRQLIFEGMAYLDGRLGMTYEALTGAAPNRRMDALFKQIVGPENQARMLFAMAVGYERGRQRFPARARAFATFQRLKVFLNEIPWHFRRVRFTLDEKRATLEFRSAELMERWVASKPS